MPIGGTAPTSSQSSVRSSESVPSCDPRVAGTSARPGLGRDGYGPDRLLRAAVCFRPLRSDDEDADRFRAEGFLALLFLAEVLLLEDFFAGDLFLDGDFVDDFFAEDLFPGDFFLDGDFVDDFFAEDFLLEDDFVDDFLAFCRRSRARAVPPIAAPSAAAPVAASTGFPATALATFFAPDPTADAASPAFSATVEIVERPASSSTVAFLRSARVIRPPSSPL